MSNASGPYVVLKALGLCLVDFDALYYITTTSLTQIKGPRSKRLAAQNDASIIGPPYSALHWGPVIASSVEVGRSFLHLMKQAR